MINVSIVKNLMPCLKQKFTNIAVKKKISVGTLSR